MPAPLKQPQQLVAKWSTTYHILIQWSRPAVTVRVIHPHRHGKDGGADSAPPDGLTDSVRPEPEPAASQNLRGRRVSRRDTFPQVTRSRRIGGTGRDGHERNRCTPVPVSHRGRQRSPLTRGEIVRHGARLRKPAAGHCGPELRDEPSRERVRGTSVCERTVAKRFRHRAQVRASCPHRCDGWKPALRQSQRRWPRRVRRIARCRRRAPIRA